jgi:hypothetical protein
LFGGAQFSKDKPSLSNFAGFESQFNAEFAGNNDQLSWLSIAIRKMRFCQHRAMGELKYPKQRKKFQGT